MVGNVRLPFLASVDTCTLCGSCYNACPTNAITFSKKHLDFSYPEVNEEKCIGCKQCQKKCPVVTPLQFCNLMDDCTAWIARNPDPEIRKKSTSGGVFYAAAQYVLQQGGYVCGAVFDDEFHVKHICSDNISDVYRMMGSKYAQSYMGMVYQQVKELLDNGKLVLYTGCPCQVAGLNAFLRENYEKLITFELICHGIPSDRMLMEYISMQESKNKSKLTHISFRSKTTGWLNSSMEINFANHRKYHQLITSDAYMRGYFGNVYLKESCYQCRFRSFSSGADCMIGDFWGAEVEKHPFDNQSGISSVLAQGQKGVNFICSLPLEKHKWDLEGIVRYNKSIITSQKPSDTRERFYGYAEKYGYEKAMKKYLSEPIKKKMERKARYYLRCAYYRLKGKTPPLY